MNNRNKLILASLLALVALVLLWLFVIGPALMGQLIRDANAGKMDVTVENASNVPEIKDDANFNKELKAKVEQHKAGQVLLGTDEKGQALPMPKK